jgi:hypothetical protein
MSLDGFVTAGARAEAREQADREKSNGQRDQDEDEKSAVPRKRNHASRQRFHFRSFYRPPSADPDNVRRFPNGGFKSDHERLPPKLARAQQRQNDRRRSEKRGHRIIGWMKRVAKLQVASQEPYDHMYATSSGKIDPAAGATYFTKTTQSGGRGNYVQQVFPGGEPQEQSAKYPPESHLSSQGQCSPASSSPVSAETGDDVVGESATGSSDVSSPDLWVNEMFRGTDGYCGSRDRMRMFAGSGALLKPAHTKAGQLCDPLERALD